VKCFYILQSDRFSSFKISFSFRTDTRNPHETPLLPPKLSPSSPLSMLFISFYNLGKKHSFLSNLSDAMKRFFQCEIGLDERFLHYIYLLLWYYIALCSLYWAGCIGLSLSFLNAQYYSISLTIRRVFGGIKINWHGQRQGFARFLASCKIFPICLVSFRVLTNNYNSSLQQSCEWWVSFWRLCFSFWTS